MYTGTNHDCQESDERELELKGDDPQAVRGMIAHLYGLDPDVYSGMKGSVFGFPGDATFLKYQINLYASADKYLVPSLRERAEDILAGGLKTNMSREQDRRDVYEVAKYIYVTYPDEAQGLRNLVVRKLFRYFKNRQYHDAFKRLLAEAPQLKADFEELVAARVKRKGKKWTGGGYVPLNYHSGESEFDTESESDSD